MVMLNEVEIQENYVKFMELINADSRATQLNVMYADFGNELLVAPASTKTHYHSAFPGGYLSHVLRVVDLAMAVGGQYKKHGGTIDFTREELVFCALHHDLGKLGHPQDGPYYLDQDSDWHRKRGEMYKHNENLQYMKAPERGLMMLQKYGIILTEKEWLGIRLSDGMYDDGAKGYLVNYSPYPMKTNISRIIHWADHMASQIENDIARF